ncbi:MAG: VCBS repeat-containing protein [Vicinamibacterales bacterium]
MCASSACQGLLARGRRSPCGRPLRRRPEPGERGGRRRRRRRPRLFTSASTAREDRLYRNDAGRFAEIAAQAGVADARATRAAAFGDLDADGDADLLVGFAPAANASVLRLYRNDGGRFVDATTAAGLSVAGGAVRQPVWVDVDGDGDLDLFVAFRDRANALFRNDHGTFTDIAPASRARRPAQGVGAVWFDMDEDGDLDVAVAGMDGDANGLFRNDGGRFVDVAEAAGVACGGRAPRPPAALRVCAADLDTDGHLDLVAANYGPLGFFGNRLGGRFEDRGAAWGWRSTRATTRARRPMSITTAGSIST